MHSIILIEKTITGLKLVVEILAALIIFIGIIDAIIFSIKHIFCPNIKKVKILRIRFSKFLSLALEFQLAADILGTSISPTWDQLGKLAAIAIIRTFLNHFLNKDTEEGENNEKQGSKN